ncbi:rhodanese-like domain-containing protein [Akkermansiaceae bacterium]|nr:rhodanese-like domain-containing protein [Akkermansiaceae bacterium]
MKKVILGVVGLGLLAVFAATATWKIVGSPDRSVPCAVDELDVGEVCLSEVKKWADGTYLWVDARPRALWQKNGISGSVLLTDDNEEDFLTLEEKFMQVAYREGDPFQKVVIYCNEEGCGSSKAIAKGLREKFTEMMGFEVFVLYGGWKALAAAEYETN